MNDDDGQIKGFILESLQEAKGVVVDHAPDIIQQYIVAETFSYLFAAIVFFCILLISAIILYKHGNKHKWEFMDLDLPLILFPAIGVIAGSIGFIESLYNFLYIYLYPNAYLLSKFI